MFSLGVGEKLRKAVRLEFEGGLLSFLPFMFTATMIVRLTNLRLAVTEAEKRGQEVTTYIPLEAILAYKQGRYSRPLWLYATAFFLLVGVVLTFLTLVFGIPFLVIGAVCLYLYFRNRLESLVVDAGAEAPVVISIGKDVARVEDLDGNRLPRAVLGELIGEIELARQLRVSDGFSSPVPEDHTLPGDHDDTP